MNEILNKYYENVETHRRLVWQVGMLFVGRISLDQLAIHDLSKYGDEEFRIYAERFYGIKNEESEANFQRAWQHHYNSNLHHWQYWSNSILSIPPYDMPPEYVIEMVCDWQAMEIQHQDSQDMSEWLSNNFDKMILHKDTRIKVVLILEEIGYRLNPHKVNSEFTLDDTTPLAAEIEKIVIRHKNLNVKE